MLWIAGLLVFLSLQLAPSAVSDFRQATDYLKIRSKARVLTDFSRAMVISEPERFRGMLLEIRGRIDAIAGSESQTTIVIQTEFGDAPTMLSLPPDKRPTDWPFLEVGVEIRALCQVVRFPFSDNGTLEVVIPVRENELRSLERAHAKAKTERAIAPFNQPVRRSSKSGSGRVIAKVSRSNTRHNGSAVIRNEARRTVVRKAPEPSTVKRPSNGQLVEIYGNAIRYFNGKISLLDARLFSSQIIDACRKYGIDARLLMAILFVEGALDRPSVLARVRSAGKASARSPVSQTAASLSKQLGPQSSRETLIGGLVRRYRTLSPQKPAPTSAIETYVNRVMLLYGDLTGAGSDELYEAPREKLSAVDIVRSCGKFVVYILAHNIDGSVSQGTGFICPGGNGDTVMTCDHVTLNARKIIVISQDARAGVEVQIAGRDAERDLMVLRAPQPLIGNLKRWSRRSAKLGDAKAAVIGSRVYVIGNPRGFDHTISEGLLSARRSDDGVAQLQISAPISPGSSGSPVFNDKGEVIGMVQSQIEDSQNLNFAIAIQECSKLLKESVKPAE